MAKNLKKPELDDIYQNVHYISDSESFKQKIKFQLSLFTEDWMNINKEDLKGIFNIMSTCQIDAYITNYNKDTKHLRHDWFDRTTSSGEQTRQWLENIVSDLVWSGFGKEAQKTYDHDRFEGFNKLIKWIKHVEPFTCINLSYAGDKNIASYTFFLRSFPKDIPKRHYGDNQRIFSFR